MEEYNIVLKDADIREPLFDFLEETFGKIRILEEKTIGRSRADVVMITENSICGIEIKSDADSYTRLPRQVKDYDRYYDYNYVVAGGSHGNHIREHVPDYWGVITVDPVGERADFYILRAALPNPKMNPRLKYGILWRNELSSILSRHSLPKYVGKSKAFIVDKLISKLPEDDLKEEAAEELFQRDFSKYRKEI